MRVKGEEYAYNMKIQGAVGGATGVVHQASSLHTDCEPNTNVEAMRLSLAKAGVESRPLWNLCINNLSMQRIRVIQME